MSVAQDPFRTVYPLPGSKAGVPTAAAVRRALDGCRAGRAKHGPLPADLFAQYSILAEEVGEVAEALNRHAWDAPCPDDVAAELADVAAVALRMITQLKPHDR